VDLPAPLTALLRRERLQLELLVFKLTELGQLLAAGDPRFLSWAAEEVERAVEAVRTTELERAVHVQGLADSLGLEPASASGDEASRLDVLAEHLPARAADLLREHGAQLSALAQEVRACLQSTRLLAAAGSAAVSELLDRAGARTGSVAELLTYGRDATSTRHLPPTPRLRTTL